MSQPGDGEGNIMGPPGTMTGGDGANLSPQQRQAMYQAQAQAQYNGMPLGMPIGQVMADARAAGMSEQQIQKLSQDAEVLEGLQGSDQNYEGRQHSEIKGFVTTGLDPAQVNQMSETFSKIKGVLDRLSQRTNESVGKARHEWEGAAAENAFGYFGQMSTWADSNAANAQLASETTYAQSGAAETAKNTMPEPVETNGLMKDFGAAVKDEPLNPMGAFNKAMETREKADAAHQEAVQVMGTYDQNLYQAASKQPAFSEPPTFSAGAGDKAGVGGGSGVIDIPGGDTTSASGYSGGQTGGAPSTGGGPSGGGGYNSPSGGGTSGVAPGPVAGRGPSTGAGQLPGTGPQGNAPASPRVPTGGGSGFGGMGPAPVGPMGGSSAGGGSTPYNSKIGGRAGSAGFGPTGGGSAAGAAKGAAGAAGAGGAPGAGPASGASKGMGGGAGAAPGAAAAAGGSGARGGSGMMGGAGAGKGQQGSEDEEHQRPSWLVEADPDSLFGTDERTAPPVIGE